MAGPNALNELRASTKKSIIKSESDKVPETKSLSEIGKGPVTVIKHPSAADEEKTEQLAALNENTATKSPSTDEFMRASESEFGNVSAPKSANNQVSANQSVNMNADNNSTNKVGSSLESEADKLLSNNKPISAANTQSIKTEKSATELIADELEQTGNTGQADETNEDEQETIADENTIAANEKLGTDEDEDEKSAAELVAAAAAQIANKTLKKTGTASGSKTLKATGKLLASAGKQEQIMKKAMLMLNESGKINVVTEEQGPSIVKLNTPVNKAQIKLRSFRQNFEKQLAEMRRKTPLQIQTLKAELANIEFAEIGNKNIIAGLLELVDDHELKLLTIEKMLKHGDITLSF